MMVGLVRHNGIVRVNNYEKYLDSAKRCVRKHIQEVFLKEINMELTSENVARVFNECLSKEKEGDNVRLVEAVQANAKMAMRKDKTNLTNKTNDENY